MKVAHVLTSLSAGGAEGFVTYLSVNMAALGADVRVVPLAGARRERGQVLLSQLEAAGIVVDGTEPRPPASAANLLRLARLIRTWKPDIVHAHLYSCDVACAWSRMLSLPGATAFARTLHSTDICGYRSPIVVKTLSRFFHLTVACSEPVARAYVEFAGERVRPRLVTIPNGVRTLDAIPNAETKRRAREALGIPEGAFMVAHIGRMVGSTVGSSFADEPKAQDVLIKAFAEAFRGDPLAALVLVGDGQLRPDAERMASDLGIAAQTRFLGEQPEPWPALTAADLFCFPSRFEGLPLVLIEAASCGLPVVASDIPEIRSLCLDDAWRLNPVDDVARFAEAMRAARADIANLSRHAREMAGPYRDKYSMRACAARYLEAYEAVRRHS